MLELHAHTRTNTHTDTCARAHTHAHTHPCSHAHAHAHVHAWVHAQGYMLELPGAKDCLHAVAALARSKGVQVALTAGDPGVVSRHRSTMQGLMTRYGGESGCACACLCVRVCASPCERVRGRERMRSVVCMCVQACLCKLGSRLGPRSCRLLLGKTLRRACTLWDIWRRTGDPRGQRTIDRSQSCVCQLRSSGGSALHARSQLRTTGCGSSCGACWCGQVARATGCWRAALECAWIRC